MLSRLFKNLSPQLSEELSDPQKQVFARGEALNCPRTEKVSELKSTPQIISDKKLTPKYFGRAHQNLEELCKQISELVQIGKQIQFRHGFMNGMRSQLLFTQEFALQISVTCALIIQSFNDLIARLFQQVNKHESIINALQSTFIHQFTIITSAINHYHPYNTRDDRLKTAAWRYFPLGLLLLMSFIGPVQSYTPCNSFPKIFGGSLGNTYLYHIDAYNDYLALAGSTQDNSLTGTTSLIPYIALSSISTGGKYYWIKALTLKISSEFTGVQFSTDGALLIAHTYSSSSYIVVFNVSSGNILSARSYSTGGYENFYSKIRSMTVSSGASPMAYVLSNFRISNMFCSEQILFKFNPLTFSSTAVWRKQTIGSSTDNCARLGLVFGRSENLLYAFSWYAGKSTVSLLDTNGNSQWQYSTPDGGMNSNMIKYKQIDAATDIVIATSGQSYINYNRIIHSTNPSTNPPYSVNTVSSKTYRDPALNSNRYLVALYIIDVDNAVSLIFNGGETDLATIKFQIPSVQYQRAFPTIQTYNSAIFTSPTVYYMGSRNTNFNTGKTPISYSLGSTNQAIVYSSDMTTTSCYSMLPTVTPTPITMQILMTMAFIPSSIYQTSSVTFLNDTQAYTTVNINQSKITSISSWCMPNTLGPFILNTVTQSKSFFTVAQGVSDQNIAITPFSATLNCGTFATTWTYTGVDNSDGHPLVAATDLMSVNPATGSIFVSKSKLIGNYIIKVIGTLPDLATQTSTIFTIQVKENTVPVFSSPLKNVQVLLMKQITYIFPKIIDPDYGAKTSIYAVEDSATGVIPSFITFQKTSLTINPTLITQVKVYEMIVRITDTKDDQQYKFNLTVIDQPPIKNKTENSSSSINNATQVTFSNLVINQSKIQTQFLTLEISDVTQDKKASIKIKNENIQNSPIPPEIIAQLTTKQFELVVQQQRITYKIEFKIIEKNLADSLIILNLRFPNPSNLSVNSTDKLKVRTVNRIQKMKKQIQTILPENTESEANIPPQIITKGFEVQAKIEKYFQDGRINFTQYTSINMVIGFIIQILWIQMLDISFLPINSLIAIPIPGIPYIIQAVMIKYIYFDVFYTELWIDQSMENIGISFDPIENDYALNQQFSEIGYDSKQFLKNSGSSIFLLIFYISFWGILLFLSLLSICSERMKAIKLFISKQLIWKQSLNFLLSQYAPLFLCSLLNMYDLRFTDKENLAKISSYISMIVLISVLCALLLIFAKVCRLTTNLNREKVIEFRINYSVLTESLKETYIHKLIYFWKPLYLLRWSLTLTIFIVLQDKPALQILSLFILSVIWQCLILQSKPFESKTINIISFCNEVMVSVYLYIAFIQSDYLDSQLPDDELVLSNLRLNFAWIITGFLILTIAINFVYTLVTIAISVFRYLKIKIKCQKESEKKYLEQQPIVQKAVQQNIIRTITDQNRFQNDNQQSLQKLILRQPMNLIFKKSVMLPFEVTKAQIYDISQQQQQIQSIDHKIETLNSLNKKKRFNIADEAEKADYSKQGYASYENYPGAYFIEEEKADLSKQNYASYEDYPGAYFIEEKKADYSKKDYESYEQYPEAQVFSENYRGRKE